MGTTERLRADETICARVTSLVACAQAQAVLTYLSFGSEVETRRIIAHALAHEKVVALPRVTGPHVMAWHVVAPGFEPALERGSFGVLEPADDPATRLDGVVLAHAVALVPGLAFDAEGHRLGYGGGYYDAFLGSFAGVSVGLAREAQVRPSLAREGAVAPHDISVDFVVTERRMIACKTGAREVTGG